MDHDDPTSQFFPDQDEVDLYSVLCVERDATAEDVKKAYRRLALLHHPDKHATADENAKANASLKFQQVGFAYSVLGDDKHRSRYDSTGKTDEGIDLGPGEDGWEAYFEELFESVTKGRLDELKKEYQGSAQEIEDLKDAYTRSGGSVDEIMTHIPHSTLDDEPRFINILSGLISSGDLPSLSTWESSVQDEKARLVRQKQGSKEAREAEELARKLGVWDEFYGSGKPSKKKGKGKGKQKQQEESDGAVEEDHSVLQALMLKRKKNMDGFFDNLAAKYAEPEPSSKGKSSRGKKRAKDDGDDVEEPPKKKSKSAIPPPDIDDEEFAKLQGKLFDKSRKRTSAKSKGSRSRRAK